LRDFFKNGGRKGIIAAHDKRLKLILIRRHTSISPDDMMLSGFKLHALKGERQESYAVTVSGNWREIYRFEGTDALNVDCLDYH
jgi:proteic killer suppression protein